MSQRDDLAALAAAPEFFESVHDKEDRLLPSFVEEVLDAVHEGDNETARRLVEPLHPADVADLIELARADEREGLVAALAEIVDAEVYAELNEHVREALVEEMEPAKLAELAGELDTDDAIALLGTPTSTTVLNRGRTLLQWQYSQGRFVGASGAYVTVLFDAGGTMVRVAHKNVIGS